MAVIAMSPAEEEAASRAVHGQREADLTLAALVGLAEFDRELATAAYEAGRSEMLSVLRALIGPATLAVDPGATIRGVEQSRPRLDFSSPKLPGDHGYWTSVERYRAGALARRVGRTAEGREP